MSNLTDAALDSMQNSEAAATYITESLFSSIFEIDGTADVMISENVKKGCPHIWTDSNYRIVTTRLLDWWIHNMPYIYLAMLEDRDFSDVLYNSLRNIIAMDTVGHLSERVYNTDGSVKKSVLAETTLFHVDFTKFNTILYKKLLEGLEKSMKSLDIIQNRVDDFVNGLTPAKRYQISYIVCNFMYILLELMHSNDMYNWLEAVSRYYEELIPSHAAVYDEEADNPGDFA